MKHKNRVTLMPRIQRAGQHLALKGFPPVPRALVGTTMEQERYLNVLTRRTLRVLADLPQKYVTNA